jgi:hypothetical protein
MDVHRAVLARCVDRRREPIELHAVRQRHRRDVGGDRQGVQDRRRGGDHRIRGADRFALEPRLHAGLVQVRRPVDQRPREVTQAARPERRLIDQHQVDATLAEDTLEDPGIRQSADARWQDGSRDEVRHAVSVLDEAATRGFLTRRLAAPQDAVHERHGRREVEHPVAHPGELAGEVMTADAERPERVGMADEDDRQRSLLRHQRSCRVCETIAAVRSQL